MATVMEEISASLRMKVPDDMTEDEAYELINKTLFTSLRKAGIDINLYDVSYTELEK